MVMRCPRALRADPDRILWTGQRVPFDRLWRDIAPRQDAPEHAPDE